MRRLRLVAFLTASATLAGCLPGDEGRRDEQRSGRVVYVSGGTYLIRQLGSPVFWLSHEPYGPQTEENDVGGSYEACAGNARTCILVSAFPLSAPPRDCTRRWTVDAYVFRTEADCRRDRQVISAEMEGQIVSRYTFDRDRGLTQFELIPFEATDGRIYRLYSTNGFLAPR